MLLLQHDGKLADLRSDLSTMANMIEKDSDTKILQASQLNQSLTNLTINMHRSIERIEIRNQLEITTNVNLSKSLTHQLEARLRDVNQTIQTELEYYHLLTEIKFANLTSVMYAMKNTDSEFADKLLLAERSVSNLSSSLTNHLETKLGDLHQNMQSLRNDNQLWTERIVANISDIKADEVIQIVMETMQMKELSFEERFASIEANVTDLNLSVNDSRDNLLLLIQRYNDRQNEIIQDIYTNMSARDMETTEIQNFVYAKCNSLKRSLETVNKTTFNSIENLSEAIREINMQTEDQLLINAEMTQVIEGVNKSFYNLIWQTKNSTDAEIAALHETLHVTAIEQNKTITSISNNVESTFNALEISLTETITNFNDGHLAQLLSFNKQLQKLNASTEEQLFLVTMEVSRLNSSIIFIQNLVDSANESMTRLSEIGLGGLRGQLEAKLDELYLNHQRIKYEHLLLNRKLNDTSKQCSLTGIVHGTNSPPV